MEGRHSSGIESVGCYWVWVVGQSDKLYRGVQWWFWFSDVVETKKQQSLGDADVSVD